MAHNAFGHDMTVRVVRGKRTNSGRLFVEFPWVYREHRDDLNSYCKQYHQRWNCTSVAVSPTLRYSGDWNRQCPYCLSKKVAEEGSWESEDGERWWQSDYCASCKKCGESWDQSEIQPDGCPNCGCYHSGTLTRNPQNGRQSDALGGAPWEGARIYATNAAAFTTWTYISGCGAVRRIPP